MKCTDEESQAEAGKPASPVSIKRSKGVSFFTAQERHTQKIFAKRHHSENGLDLDDGCTTVTLLTAHAELYT